MWTLVQTAGVLLQSCPESPREILSSCTTDPVTPRSKALAPTLHPQHGHQDRVQTLPQEQAYFSLSSSDFSPLLPS